MPNTYTESKQEAKEREREAAVAILERPRRLWELRRLQ
jgi:hypothetical protein